MKELNVLQLALLISRRYKYFVFEEMHPLEMDKTDPLFIYMRVIPAQKLQEAKNIRQAKTENSFILKSMMDYRLLFDMAQGIAGIKYFIEQPHLISEPNKIKVF